ncbi:MAG: hypothetical protein NTW76_02085 [Corynebacteriales bacterium]|nr:hypothetical protein [Mycobacteriales bacterium]
MTEPTTTDAGDTTTQPEPESPPADTAPDPAPEATPNSEAARYRVQLRETEATLATTANRLEAYQRRAAEGLLTDVLDTPADLWEIGQVDLRDFIDSETGEINADDLQAAAEKFVEQRPKLGAKYERFGSAFPKHPNWGQNGEQPPGETGWSQVLGGR